MSCSCVLESSPESNIIFLNTVRVLYEGVNIWQFLDHAF